MSARKKPKGSRNHGGFRWGAARPKLPETRVMVSLRLAPDAIEFLKTQPNKTQLIESLIYQYEDETMDKFLKQFIGTHQLALLRSSMFGEEGKYYRRVMRELRAKIEAIPTYGSTGNEGDRAPVYLHYFLGPMDWYITERDSGEEQRQAFGWADLGQGGGELGLISIHDIIAHHAELDLYWEPKPLGEVLKRAS